jgi:preprotein translocase subunit SecG
MYILFLLIHVVVCIFLIIVVLLQSGKAADLAGAFGGMGSQTAFGPRGSATLLSKAGLGTTVLESAPAGSAPVKGAPVQVQVPSNGKQMSIPVPVQTQQNVPVQPAPAKK